MTPDFKTLFEAGPGLYLVLTPQLHIIAVSDAYLRATLTQREQIVGRHLFDVFPDNPDDTTATGVGNLRRSLEQVIATGTADTMAVQKYDIRRSEADGGGFEERHWSPRNNPVFGPDGVLKYIIHEAEDVTDFIKLRAKDDEARGELQTRAGQLAAEVARRAQELQVANTKLRNAEEETRAANTQLEARVVARTHELEAANAALTSEIKEREAIEVQFRQAQKMEAIGQLAGGVAHDFNNLLTVILSGSLFVRNELGPSHSSIADLDQIDAAAERAAALTKQLLTFSRKQVTSPVVVDLNAVVTDSLKMLQRLIGEHIDVAPVLSAELGRVRADRGHLEQVLMNLFVNARDAMPSGGKLTVETANVELDFEGGKGRVSGAKPGPYVMLAVSDTGTGMDAQTLEQIFLPFFTTKTAGKGTGLGLAMVHGVVKQLEGEIVVYSSVGKGTTFKVYLPRLARGADEPAPLPERRSTHGTETIVVLDDEESIRRVAQRALALAGYQVLIARDGAHAVELCQGSVHLLLSDVIMPDVDGPTIAARIQGSGVKVLFMSGYTGGALVRHGVLEEGVAYLPKPFTPDTLVAKVRDVLDGIR